MEELIARIAQTTNLSPDLTRTAIGMILDFVRQHAPAHAQALINLIPGANDMMAAGAQEASSGLIGGLLGGIGKMLGNAGGIGAAGGLAALTGQLLNAGVSMDQAKTVATELFEFGRSKLGDDHLAELTSAIPGLSQLLR